MPRAHRYITTGQNYHLTHRCHDRSFLLKFAKDRDLYRVMLRERLSRFRISLLGHCITSNHTHLLVNAGAKEDISALMQSLEGDFAQRYNLRKKRSGAFWADRYHATLVQGGRYLRNCLRYIDLNMVRAGVVAHPEQWDWCSYRELAGLRKRYRLIDQEKLEQVLGDGYSMEGFRENYVHIIQEAVRNREWNRQAMWTESLAIGDRGFVEQVEHTLKNRKVTEIVGGEDSDSSWILREAQADYA